MSKRKYNDYNTRWKSCRRYVKNILQTVQNDINISNCDECLDSGLEFNNDILSNDLQTANTSLDEILLANENNGQNDLAITPNSSLSPVRSQCQLNVHCIDETEDFSVVENIVRDWQTADDTTDSVSEMSHEENLDEQGIPEIQNQLAQWVNKHNVTHAAVGDLLKILQCHNMNVPASAKTLMKTPRNIVIEHKSGGDYKYLGLQRCLEIQLESLQPSVLLDELSSVDLSFNIDGLPLFCSSTISLWPILCFITNLAESSPFAVAFFCGSQKPSDLEFTVEFISELNHLMLHGFKFCNKLIAVKVHSIICDAPAKCFVKGTVQFNGYYGCDKCEQKGVYDGRMTYSDTDSALRTDHSFRKQTNEEHHKIVSPFCSLEIDMIKAFPIDVMHQSHLGVTKRLLLQWISGPLKTRLSSVQVEMINKKILHIKQFIPVEFARKPRTLKHVRLWKATEFRQFLMYTGPFVLKHVLPQKWYDNFMCLHVGLCLLVNPVLVEQHRIYAKQLLVYFVKDATEIYGRQFISYNVHSVVHLSDVAADFGSLESCSAYKFENYLQKLKRLVRSPKNPLSQIVARLTEINSVAPFPVSSHRDVLIKKSVPNNCFKTTAGHFCLVHDIVSNGKEVICELFRQRKELYDDPCDSRLLGVFKISLRHGIMKRMLVSDLCEKCVCIKISPTKVAILPLSHTFM